MRNGVALISFESARDLTSSDIVGACRSRHAAVMTDQTSDKRRLRNVYVSPGFRTEATIVKGVSGVRPCKAI